jgi:phage replisome organizer, putative, N-terminal region
MIKMKERRYVKFKVDIYDDTKTKIIDQRPERDFIHYFFARSIILAGKADCEGKLNMGKDIPYTIETLAIEFNRDAELVKLALDVLIELKMIEVTEDNIYRVKSFVKHQNIKVKEEDKGNGTKETMGSENNKEVEKKEIKPIVAANKEVEIKEDKQIGDSRGEKIKTQEECRNQNIEVQENIQSNSEKDNLVVLEMKDNKKSKKKKNESSLITELAVDEIEDDPPILVFSEGDMPPLGEGERIIWGMSPI